MQMQAPAYTTHIKGFYELSSDELYEIIRLRIDVFVVEQDCAYSDLDGKDQEATHLSYTLDGGRVIGYLRILDKGISYEEMSIGRVIIDPEFRKYKLGSKLMIDAINHIEKQGDGRVRISAQQHLKKFYERLGFNQVSDMYLEDSIPHVEMLK